MAIRFAREADLPQILAIYAPYVTGTTFSFEYEVPSLDVFTQRFLNITTQFPWLVWEEDGLILGYAYASSPFARAAYQWCCEPSIYLLPRVQGRGIGKKLYTVLETLLRMQGYQLSYAIITSENTASLAFHKAMGYSHLADFPGCGFKHGRCLGITWLQKRLNAVEIPSKAPVNVSFVVKSDRNFAEILDKLSLS